LTADQELELTKARQKLRETQISVPTNIISEMETQQTKVNSMLENKNKERELAINQLVDEGVIFRKEADKRIAESNLQLTQERLDNEIHYLARLKEFNKANPTIEGSEKILAKETEITELKIQLIQMEEQAQQARFDAVIESQDKANRVIEASAKEREIKLQQLVNDGLISRKDADRQIETSNQEVNRNKLIQEQKALEELRKLYQENPSLESLKTIEDKTKEVSELTLQVLKDEYDAQTRIVDLMKEKIDYENKSLDVQSQGLSSIEKSLDIQSKLSESRFNLQKALSDLETGRTQIKIDELQSDIDATNSEAEKLKLKQDIYDLEKEASKQRLQALLREQEQQRISLQLEQRRNELASKRNELDAQKAVNDANIALLEAKRGGDIRDIALAQEGLNLALENLSFTREENQNTQLINKQSEQALLAQQQLAREQFTSSESIKLTNLKNDINNTGKSQADKPVTPDMIANETTSTNTNKQQKRDDIEKELTKQMRTPSSLKIGGSVQDYQVLSPSKITQISNNALSNFNNMASNIVTPILTQLTQLNQQIGAIASQRPVINQTNTFENKFADTDQSKLLAKVRGQTYDQILQVMAV
jgi:hypothetical protein